MDTRQIANAYQTYKELDAKKNEIKRYSNFVRGVYNFHAKQDAETYKKLSDGILGLVAKNPIGKMLVKFYAPHFKALNEAIAATEKKIPTDQYFKDLLDKLQAFNSNYRALLIYAPDPVSIAQGPLTYLAKLERQNPGANTEDLMNVVMATIYFVKWLIRHHDKMLYLYVPLTNNLRKIGDMAETAVQKEYESSRNIFEKLSMSLLMMGNANMGISISSNIDSIQQATKANLMRVCANRNSWAEWLGIPAAHFDQFDIIKNVKDHLAH